MALKDAFLRHLAETPDVYDALDALGTRQTHAKFEQLGRVVFELYTTAGEPAREATSHSSQDTVVDKEKRQEEPSEEVRRFGSHDDVEWEGAFPPYDLSEHEALQQGIVNLDE